MVHRRQVVAASAVVASVFAACGGGDRQVTGPGPGNGGPSFATLTVTVTVDPDDAALAQALGWAAGVPGAEVSILRNGTEEWVTATTDAQGRVEFPGLLRGLYRIYAGRTLTQGEAAGAGEPIRAFGDGVSFDVNAVGDVPLALSLVADDPGGIVISEIVALQRESDFQAV